MPTVLRIIAINNPKGGGVVAKPRIPKAYPVGEAANGLVVGSHSRFESGPPPNIGGKMRVNIYAEEMTDRIEIISKEIVGG